MRLSSALFLFAGLAVTAQPWPLPDRVVVVYNAGDAESASVANYYATRRAIPPANLCPVLPPSNVALDRPTWEATVRNPVRACVDAVGRAKTLYIVMAYKMPYKLSVNGRVYGLDSAMSDLFDEQGGTWSLYPDAPHAYAAFIQSQGNYYQAFQSLSDHRAAPGAKTIFSVFRLDAPSAAIAQGMVDKAIAAETSGLSGIACIDRRGGLIAPQADASYSTAEWDMSRAASFLAQAGFTVVEDSNYAEFGTSPAPARCDGAILYTGWYSFNNYNDAFSWNTGAIGFHLDSASALDPRGGPNWSANAMLRGITMTSGSISEPYLDGLLHPDGFFRDLLGGANVGDAALRHTPHTKWMVSHFGDPLYRPFAGGRAPFPLGAEDWFVVSPQGVIGGSASTGFINLAVPAPPGGITVNLLSKSPAVATVPASATVPAGATGVAFPISTLTTTVVTSAILNATIPGKTLANTIITAPYLGAMTVSANSVVGGGTLTGTVYLNTNAPPGGILVTLSSSAPAASVPLSVAIPAGSGTATFPISTAPVSVNTPFTITAVHAGTAKTASATVAAPTLFSLTLSPNRVTGGAPSTGTVTLNGVAPAGGMTVALACNSSAATVPPSVAVPGGALTASFPISTVGVGAVTTATITATLAAIRTANLTIDPSLQSLSVTTPQMGGGKLNLTVTLASNAPSGGTTVALASNSASAPVPPSALIAAGTRSATVVVTTLQVTMTTNVTFTATLGATSRTAVSRLEPAIISYVYGPPTVKGGTRVAMQVTLNAPAPPGGTVVTMSSTNGTLAPVPPTLTIPAGSLSGFFSIDTLPVSASTAITIRATNSFGFRERLLTLTP